MQDQAYRADGEESSRRAGPRQRQLFTPPRKLKRRATRDMILAPGCYDSAEVVLAAWKDGADVSEHLRITASCKAVYRALLRHLRGESDVAVYPSEKRLAHFAGCTVQTVSDCLRRLEARGWGERLGPRYGRLQWAFAVPEDIPGYPEQVARFDPDRHKSLIESLKRRAAANEPTSAHPVSEGEASGKPKPNGRELREIRSPVSGNPKPDGREFREIRNRSNLCEATRASNSAGPVVAVKPIQEANAEVLRRIGVDPAAAKDLDDLAARPGLTPLSLALLASQMPARARNPAGWVLSRLRAGSTGPHDSWGPRDVCQIIDAGYLDELDGHRLDGVLAGYRTDAVYLFRSGQAKDRNEPFARIPTARLRALARGTAGRRAGQGSSGEPEISA